MSKQHTQNYIDAFSTRNLDAVASLLHEDVVLEDPVVIRVEGKLAVLAAVKAIFDSVETLSFSARNIFEDGSTTLIEFRLVLGETVLTGVDIIEWEDGKLRELRAYLDVPKA